MLGHDLQVSSSLLWSLDDELWVKSESKVVVSDGHLEISDADQVNESVWKWDDGNTVWTDFVNPWNDHVEGHVEEMSHSLVGVHSLKVVDDLRRDLSSVHFDSEPLGVDVHTLEPHIEINDDVVIFEGHDVVREVIVPDLDLAAVLDSHLLLVVDETWCSNISESSTQWNVVSDVVSQIWDKLLQSSRVPVDWELNALQVIKWEVNSDCLLSKYGLKHEVNNFSADLVLKWLWACESEVTELEILILMDLLIIGESHDLTLEIAEHSSVLDVSTVVIGHLIVDVDAAWNMNIVLWEDIYQRLDNS